MKMTYWSEEDINFLKESYVSKGTIYCAKYLNRKVKAVSHKASRLGLKASRIEYSKRSAITQEHNFDKSGKAIASPEAWKKRVKRIFNFTCADCNLFCPTICVVHHIEEQYRSPHLKYEVSNGVCLCPNCHSLRHVALGRKFSGKRLSKIEKQQVRELYLAGYSVEKISAIIGVNHKTVANYK